MNTARCVATDVRERRCILDAGHEHDHVPATDSYHLGKLQEAVREYLAGRSSVGHLHLILSEVDAEVGR